MRMNISILWVRTNEWFLFSSSYSYTFKYTCSVLCVCILFKAGQAYKWS